MSGLFLVQTVTIHWLDNELKKIVKYYYFDLLAAKFGFKSGSSGGSNSNRENETKGKKEDKDEEKENNPEKDFLKNVLVMVHDMIAKISSRHNPERKRLLDLISDKAKFILDEMKSSDHQHVPKREMTELIFLFNKFFAKKKKEKEDE